MITLKDRLRFNLHLQMPQSFLNKQYEDGFEAVKKVVELNPEWCIYVLNTDAKITEIVQDFYGIHSEDENYKLLINPKGLRSNRI